MCRGPECGEQRGSQDLYAELERQLAARGISERVSLGWQSCFGRCAQACNVLVKEARDSSSRPSLSLAALPGQGARRTALYSCVTRPEIELIVTSHLVGGRRVRAMMQHPSDSRRDEKLGQSEVLRETERKADQ